MCKCIMIELQAASQSSQIPQETGRLVSTILSAYNINSQNQNCYLEKILNISHETLYLLAEYQSEQRFI